MNLDQLWAESRLRVLSRRLLPRGISSWLERRMCPIQVGAVNNRWVHVQHRSGCGQDIPVTKCMFSLP